MHAVQSANTVMRSHVPPQLDDTLVWLLEASIAVFRRGIALALLVVEG